MSVVLALLGCRVQDRFLYYPERSVPSDEALTASDLLFWPEREGYRGFLSVGGPPRPKGTIVVFHGNAGTAADRVGYAAALGPLGYRVLLAEYPGYGRRSGRVGEAAFAADGRETLRRALGELPGPLFVLGESLGAGVAAAVVREGALPVRGLILVTPWDTLENAARQHFPALAVRCLLADRYDSARNLRSFRGPIAVAAAGRDEIIPVQLARNLFASLPGEKRLWVFENARHNDWLAGVRPAWWGEVMEFLEAPQGAASGR